MATCVPSLWRRRNFATASTRSARFLFLLASTVCLFYLTTTLTEAASLQKRTHHSSHHGIHDSKVLPSPVKLRRDIPWFNLTAAQLANISLFDVAAATLTDLNSIPPLSCVGWTKAQLGVITSSCVGLSAPCIGNMTTDAVSGFIDDCGNAFTSQNTPGFTAAQLPFLQIQVWAAFTPDSISGFTIACSNLTAGMVAAIGENVQKYPSVADACGGFSTQCIVNVPNTGFSQLTTNCVQWLSTDAWSTFLPLQIANMSTTVFDTISVAQLSSITNGCSGLQGAQLAQLSDLGPLGPPEAPRMCSVLQIQCIAVLQPQALAGLGADCVADLNSTAFSLLDTTQVGAFNINGSMGLTRQDISALNACDGLSSTTISVLGSYMPPFDSCAGFYNTCLSIIDPWQFAAFQPTCFSNIPSTAFNLVTAEQVGNISLKTIQGLTSQVLAILPPESCHGFTEQQVTLFGTVSPYDTCAGFSVECLQSLTSPAFGALTSACFSNIPSILFSSFSLKQIAAISMEAVSGVTAAQLVQWTKKYDNDFIGTTWSPARTNDLSRDTILGFKQAIYASEIQVNYSLPQPPSNTVHHQRSSHSIRRDSPSVLDLSSITSLQLAYCVSSCMTILLSSEPGAKPNILFLPLHSYRGLRSDQLASIPALIFAQFSSNVFSQLLPDATGAITTAQIQAIDPLTFPSLDLGSLSVDNGVVAALSQGQIQSVSAAQWQAQWTCAQYNNFTDVQRNWMGSAATAGFVVDCSGGAAPGPVPPDPTPPKCPPDTPGFSQSVFLGSVIGGVLGAFVLSILAYFCCLRPSNKATLPHSQSNLGVTDLAHASAVSVGSPHLHGSYQANGRRIKAESAAASLRTPLNPNGMNIPNSAGRPSSSPILRQTPPAFASAHVGTQEALRHSLEDDEDDIIGSRF